MAIQQEVNSSNPVLFELIARRISESPQQRITFAEYMELVLYHPQQGYYATNQVNIGAKGDFFTSPHLGADFGELLAEQFAEMWRLLNQPIPFTLVEMGAGQGLLVQDVVHHLQRQHFECFEALRYIIVEKSTALIAEQQRRLQAAFPFWKGLSWRKWTEIPADSIVGCCFSNELVDAFPVHRFAVESGQLREIYLTTEDAQLIEVVGKPSTPQLATYFDLIGIELPSSVYPEGYSSEVNLAALDWLSTVSARLQRGYLLTIDYGYPATRYYSPARSQGTLQCYYQHTHHSNPYIHVGRQDLTAHVDFTALERQGERCELETVGFTQQGLFLMALGLGDRLSCLFDEPASPLINAAEIESGGLGDRLRRREAIHSLMNPMGLGGFGVLIQGKRLKGMEKSYASENLEENRGPLLLRGLKTPTC